MAQKLETDIVINLAGNLAAKAKRYGNSMSDFARKNEKAMSLIRRTSDAAGRGIDRLGNRYVGLAAAATTGFALNKFRDLDRQLSRLAISADITRDKAKSIWDDIQKSSSEFKVDPQESLAAVQEIMTKIGDLDYALKNKRNIPLVIQATGASGEAVGGILTEFKKLNIDTQEKAMKAIDTLNVQGKSGAFPLSGMAQFGPEIFAAYAATGRQGVDAAREIGASLQVIRDGVGSDAEAVTSYTSFLNDIMRPQTVKTLKQVGINVFDPEQLKKGKEVMRSLPAIMEEIVVKSHGLSKNLAMLNLGEESKRALNNLIKELKQTGKVDGFDKFLKITGDGTQTLKDAKVAASDFDAAMQSISSSVGRFADNELAKPIQEIADAINGVDQETVHNWLKWGEAAVIAIGTVVAAKKALDAGMWAKKMFSTGGIAGAGKGNLQSLGATPVYVVNMPGAGMGGGFDSAGEGESSNPSKSKTKASRTKSIMKTAVNATILYPAVNAVMDAAIGDTAFGKWAKKTTLGDVWNGLTGGDSNRENPTQRNARRRGRPTISEMVNNLGGQGSDASAFATQIIQNIASPAGSAQSLNGQIAVDVQVSDDRVKAKAVSRSPFLSIHSDPDAGQN